MVKKKRKNTKKRPIVIAVSGGFDPIHIGHIRYIEGAKEFGDKVVVILNNDNWLRAKKGHVFMPQRERKEIIEALRVVDKVVLTRHPKGTKDFSVNEALQRAKPNIFANGGDRVRKNIPEVKVCKELGCKMIFNVGSGGKVQSSSWLLRKHAKGVGRKR